MPIRPYWAHGDQISLDQLQTLWLSLYHDNTSLLGMTRHYCSGSIRQFPDLSFTFSSFSIVQLIQTAALVRGLPYDTVSPLLTRSTYLSDCGPCTSLPVYKHPVFRQSSPKLDLVSNTTVINLPLCLPFFPTLLYKPLRVVSSNTRDFYSFKYLLPSLPLSTSRTIKAHCSLNTKSVTN